MNKLTAKQVLKKETDKAKKEALELALLQQIRSYKLQEPLRQYKFTKERKWTFDFCWPDLKIAVEVEGGIWTQGRHTRGKGFENDCIKYGEAMTLGWNTYRCTGGMIKSGLAIETIMNLVVKKH